MIKSLFTPEELAELARFDADVDAAPDYDPEEVKAQRERDKKILEERLTPRQLRKRKSDREYYQRNKERILARNSEYVSSHEDTIREYRKQYFAKNIENIMERRKAYEAANAESIAEYQRQYHLLHKDEHNAYSRQYRLEHLEEERERSKRWREAHKDQIKAYRAANRERDNARARERYARKKAQQADKLRNTIEVSE